jgi:hypothetical protein
MLPSRGSVHFFLDDYRFESVWTSPANSLARVSRVGCALTPDFSLWRDMPIAAQIWQTYRSRWIGAYWQAHNIDVIPTACWSTEASYSFCFAGIPTGSTIAVSAVGLRAHEVDRALYRAGLAALLDTVQPQTILSYGPLKRHCDGMDLPNVVEYPTFWDRRRKQIGASLGMLSRAQRTACGPIRLAAQHAQRARAQHRQPYAARSPVARSGSPTAPARLRLPVTA